MAYFGNQEVRDSNNGANKRATIPSLEVIKALSLVESENDSLKRKLRSMEFSVKEILNNNDQLTNQNAELTRKNAELTRQNAELRNLISSMVDNSKPNLPTSTVLSVSRSSSGNSKTYIPSADNINGGNGGDDSIYVNINDIQLTLGNSHTYTKPANSSDAGVNVDVNIYENSNMDQSPPLLPKKNSKLHSLCFSPIGNKDATNLSARNTNEGNNNHLLYDNIVNSPPLILGSETNHRRISLVTNPSSSNLSSNIGTLRRRNALNSNGFSSNAFSSNA